MPVVSISRETLRGRARSRTLDVASRFVFAQSLIDHLAQQIVFGPGQKLDLGDEFRPHPMDAAENQRRSETVVTRGRDI